MELFLTEPEVRMLTEILQADRKDLLLQIARTDNRAMREGLNDREESLRGRPFAVSVIGGSLHPSPGRSLRGSLTIRA